ncbi:MAG: hypothetical protein AAB497_03585 [Patescibacteria group bacterium]
MSLKEKNGGERNSRKILKRVVLICVFLVATAFLVDAVMLAVGVRTGSLERWYRDQYAGQIVELRSGGFVIQDQKQDGKIVIKVDEQTIMRMGRNTIKVDELILGRYTIVFGSQSADGGAVEARVVRVFDGDKSRSFLSF